MELEGSSTPGDMLARLEMEEVKLTELSPGEALSKEVELEHEEAREIQGKKDEEKPFEEREMK